MKKKILALLHTVSIVALAAFGGLAMTAPITGCTAEQQAEFATTAEKLQANIIVYGQTLGNMFQTASGDIAGVASSASTLATFAKTVASAWGMLPADSDQLSTFNAVIKDIGTVGTDATALNVLLTGLQKTGQTPSTPATTTSLYLGVPLRRFI